MIYAPKLFLLKAPPSVVSPPYKRRFVTEPLLELRDPFMCRQHMADDTDLPRQCRHYVGMLNCKRQAPFTNDFRKPSGRLGVRSDDNKIDVAGHAEVVAIFNHPAKDVSI